MLTSASLTHAGSQQAEMLAKLDGLLKARKPHGEPTVLYISDAAVGAGFDMEDLFARFRAEMAKIGVVRIIPVELSFVPPMSLTKLLGEADCVYVEMGNTFYLRYYMHTSGFDKVLPPLVRHSGLVYAGASSGAIVAGRSISTAFWKGWDDPGHGQVWDLSRIGYDGLNILPGGQSVFPHYGAQWSSLVETKRGELGHGLLVIHDSEVHLAESSVEQAPIHKGRSQSVFSSRPTIQSEVGPLTTVKEVNRSASVFAPRPVANTEVGSLISVARPFPTVSLPTFADSPSKFVPGVSKFVPTTVPLAFETLIGA
jgi:peptidase E